MHSDPIETILRALRERGLQVEQKGQGHWMCQCPAHPDHNPSLSLSVTSNGNVLLNCFAGCRLDQIMESLALDVKALFADGGGRTKRRVEACTYTYVDADGVTPKHATVRYEPKSFSQYWVDSSGCKVWSFREGWFIRGTNGWRRLDSRADKDGPAPKAEAVWFSAFQGLLLYGLKKVLDAAASGGTVWLCEGEKDADALGRLKDCRGDPITATTQAMGAGKWRESYTQWLNGATVHLVLDNDEPGKKHGLVVFDSLYRAGIPVRLFLPAVGKDVSDHISAGLSIEQLVEVDITDLRSQLAESNDCDLGEDRFDVFELTDLGNAKRFASDHGDSIFNCPSSGGWHIWSGRCWKRDISNGAPLLQKWEETLATMKKEAEQIASQASATGNPNERKRLAKRLAEVNRNIKRSNGRTGIQSMLSLAGILPALVKSPEELDQRLDLLPVSNGVVDLRSGELVAGSRDYYFTRSIDLDFDPINPCPVWIEHLTACTGGDLVYLDWLQKAFGYCLTGLTTEQILFFLYGSGATGKSTTLNTLGSVIGPFSTGLNKNKLMRRRFEEDIQSHLAKLSGTRLVSVPEVERRDTFDESLVKTLTGDEYITVRPLRENSFDMPITCKLMLTGNDKPRVEGQDSGIWRRILLVPFENEIPIGKRDREFSRRLQAERPGILAWLVRGAQRWFEEGLGSCPVVEEASKEYKAEQDLDRNFIDECLLLDSNQVVMGSSLYARYKAWCDGEGMRAKNNNQFTRDLLPRLKQHGVEKVKVSGGSLWRGLGLRESEFLSS